MNSEPSFITLENNITMIKEIARKLGKRTSLLNLRDPQVARSSWDWRDSLSGKPSPSDDFSRKLSFKANRFRVTLRVNDEFLAADVKGAFGNSVVCSFVHNKVHDPSRKLAPNSICKAFGYKVYSGSIPNAESTISFLQNPSHQVLVKALQLSQMESLHIGNGWASIYLQRFIGDDVLKTLDILYHLLALIPPAEEASINYQDLPEDFHKLVPWIKRWGICDDNERSEKISKASSNVLAKLVDAVEPEFSAINTFLDSFQNKPLTDQAILLGALAEGASEAKLLLKRRLAEKKEA
jgi:hypothetical protein